MVLASDFKYRIQLDFAQSHHIIPSKKEGLALVWGLSIITSTPKKKVVLEHGKQQKLEL